MPQRPVLVFKNSKPNSARSKLDSVRWKPLRADSSALQWGTALHRLRVEHPEAAALIQQLILDAIDMTDKAWRRPPLE